MSIRSLLISPIAVAGYVVSTITVIGAVVLAALGRVVPDQLWTLAEVGLAGGVGATMPGRSTEPASPPPAPTTTGA